MRTTVKIREAGSDDMNRVFEWRTLPEIVSLSEGQKTVTLQEHEEWFKRSLQNEARKIYIIEIDGVASGLLRFDKINANAGIGIYLVGGMKGKGYGRVALLQGLQKLKEEWGVEHVQARVRADNAPSRAFFERAGFRFHADEGDMAVYIYTPASRWQADDARNIAQYTALCEAHGVSHRTLDWGSKESQFKRFKVLAEIGMQGGDSVLDVGCGLGDFYEWALLSGLEINYKGIDITPALVEKAQERFPPGQGFAVANILDEDFDGRADYVIASGIFAKRSHEPLEFMKVMIARMYELSRKGMAFNVLSVLAKHFDPDHFSAHPQETLEFCRSLAVSAELRTDYHPNDFTIYMHKEIMA